MKQRQHRRPWLEVLEDRTVPAGHVSARVADGVLVVTGDRFDNTVQLDRTGLDPGQVRITGLPGGGEATLINGEQTSVVLSGVTRAVRVSLGRGNDRLAVQDAALPAGLRVVTGDGRDSVLLDGLTTAGSLSIETGAARDVLTLTACAVAGASALESGAGADLVALDGSTFDGRAVVTTGLGDDTVYLDGSRFGAGLSLQTGPGRDLVTDEAVAAEFDFRDGALGWEAGFADYPAGEEAEFELDAGVRPLPAELGPGTGFMLQGDNHSDDLFMFLKRALGPADGIRPGQGYLARFTLTFGSNAPEGSFGIGGSPGASVRLKAGATPDEPRAEADGEGFVRMNVDKGEQNVGGLAASVAGDLANGLPPDPNVETQPYASVRRLHVHEFEVRAGADGRLWLLVGTDSGFEGLTRLFFQRIEVKLIPVA